MTILGFIGILRRDPQPNSFTRPTHPHSHYSPQISNLDTFQRILYIALSIYKYFLNIYTFYIHEHTIMFKLD